MNCFFIINPQSQNGRSKKKVSRLFALLKQYGISYDYEFTTSLDHAYVLSQKANQNAYEVIVAVGGDGTVNNVLNGFFDENGHRISQARMGVIHTGTSPDFCKTYNIPKSLDSAVRTIAKCQSIPVTVGKIACSTARPAVVSSIATKTRFFGCCANIGLGADLARTANSGIRKYAGDILGTFFSLLKVLIHYKPADVSLTIDGRTRTINRLFDIAVGKTRYIASGIQIRHELDSLDKRLYVVIINKVTIFNIVQILTILYGGKPITSVHPFISIEYGSQISITGSSPLKVEFDGDPAGFCPCTISTAPDTLDLITENS